MILKSRTIDFYKRIAEGESQCAIPKALLHDKIVQNAKAIVEIAQSIYRNTINM